MKRNLFRRFSQVIVRTLSVICVMLSIGITCFAAPTITDEATDIAGNALVVPAVGGLPIPNPTTFTTGAEMDNARTGDINNDDVINISDVILCLRQAIDLDPDNPALADMNGDGFVTIADVILILRQAIGLDYTVSVSVLGGHGTALPLNQNITSGGTASIVITPDADYHIASIKDNGSLVTITNPYKIINVTADHSVVVTFSVLVHRGPEPVIIGSTSTFRVLAGSAITNTDVVGNRTRINGNVGVSPGSTVNGLTELVNIVTPFHIYAGGPIAATAKEDLLIAYTDAQSRSTTAISLPGQLGGLTLAPGLYVNSISSGISGTGANAILTLDGQGDPNAVWIFKMGSTLITDPNTSIVLIGSAHADNIFWQVGSSATLGVNSIFYGTILSDASITINTGATLHGRALTRSGAVTLDTNQLVP